GAAAVRHRADLRRVGGLRGDGDRVVSRVVEAAREGERAVGGGLHVVDEVCLQPETGAGQAGHGAAERICGCDRRRRVVVEDGQRGGGLRAERGTATNYRQVQVRRFRQRLFERVEH